MEMAGTDFDRIVFFEHARKTAEAAYAANPLDAENLTRWGGALLELSQFQDGPESVRYLEEAVAKLEEALRVEPKKHDAMWCLGNAYTSRAFFTPDHDVATIYFDKAAGCFREAVDEDPNNELYHKSLELAAKAPELHLELHRQMAAQKASQGQGGPSASNVKASKKNANNDLMYDVLGWVILAVGIVAWVGMAKSHPPPSPR